MVTTREHLANLEAHCVRDSNQQDKGELASTLESSLNRCVVSQVSQPERKTNISTELKSKHSSLHKKQYCMADPKGKPHV